MHPCGSFMGCFIGTTEKHLKILYLNFCLWGVDATAKFSHGAKVFLVFSHLESDLTLSFLCMSTLKFPSVCPTGNTFNV